MSWKEKSEQFSFEGEPISGLYFIDGDVLAKALGARWVAGQKYPRIAFPSGEEFDLWEGSRSPIVHIYGEMDLALHDTRDAAFEYASNVAEQCGYVASTVGEAQLEVWGHDHDEHFLVTYDNEQQRMVDIAQVKEEKKKPLFPLGQVVATPGALEGLEQAGQLPAELLERHVTGDWGDLPEDDKQENDLSVKQGFRILSAYNLEGGTRLWVITEADRSTTTILRPDEY